MRAARPRRGRNGYLYARTAPVLLRRVLKNSSRGHSEEPQATKNPSLFIALRKREIPFEAQGMLRFACLRRQAHNDNQRRFFNKLLGAAFYGEPARRRAQLLCRHEIRAAINAARAGCAAWPAFLTMRPDQGSEFGGSDVAGRVFGSHDNGVGPSALK